MNFYPMLISSFIHNQKFIFLINLLSFTAIKFVLFINYPLLLIIHQFKPRLKFIHSNYKLNILSIIYQISQYLIFLKLNHSQIFLSSICYFIPFILSFFFSINFYIVFIFLHRK